MNFDHSTEFGTCSC